MTISEAIKITDPATRREALYIYDPEDRKAVENEARHLVAQALREKHNGGWISVKDRLPDENDIFSEFIVMIKDAKHPTLLQYQGREWWGDAEGYSDTYNVTHWQPLPEAPKGE